MTFLETYGKEVVALLVPLLTWVLNTFFRAKARLFLANPHTFTFLVQTPLVDPQGNQIAPRQTVHTRSLMVWNAGKETATKIEWVFNWKPLCLNVWPSRHFQEHTEPDMSRPFTCAVCGITTSKRSHFYWLTDFVGVLFGQVWFNADGPVCVRCAPRWATALGRALYVLIAICLVLAAWKFGLFGGVGEKTPNPSIQSGRAASVAVLRPLIGWPAADFRR